MDLLAARSQMAIPRLDQVALDVVGSGYAMNGLIVVPDVTLDEAGAEPAFVDALLGVLSLGAFLLAPALWYSFRIVEAAPRSP